MVVVNASEKHADTPINVTGNFLVMLVAMTIPHMVGKLITKPLLKMVAITH